MLALVAAEPQKYRQWFRSGLSCSLLDLQSWAQVLAHSKHTYLQNKCKSKTILLCVLRNCLGDFVINTNRWIDRCRYIMIVAEHLEGGVRVSGSV